jgi:PAS domain S-box-containing protein
LGLGTGAVREGVDGPPRHPRIASLLVALAAIAVLPFLVLTTYLSYRLIELQTDQATDDLQRSVEVTVNSVERLLGRTHVLLRGLAQRELVRALDPSVCDPALAIVLRLNVEFSNVFTADASGTRGCSGAPPPEGTPATIPGLDFAAILARGIPVISAPTLDAVSGKWVVYVVEPLPGGDRVAGVVGVALDLKALGAVLDPRTLPSAGVVAIVDRKGAVVARHPDGQLWIGRDASAAPAVTAAREAPPGAFPAMGLDGIDRFWAHARVKGADWTAFSGVPAVTVLQGAQRLKALMLAIGGLLVIGVVLATLALARRISEPIEAMAAKAPDLGREGANPLTLAGPAEAVALAQNLNRMHDQRLALHRQLRGERERLERLVESAMDAVIILDADRRVILFNPAAERMFGVRADAALGNSLDRFIPERFRIAHAEHIRRFELAAAAHPTKGLMTTVRGLRASGEEFPIEAAISQAQVGAEHFLTVIVRDITARVSAELEMRELAAGLEQRVAERTAELEAANQELQAFDYSISHDLRGPLGRILGFATALSEDYGDRLEEPGRRYLARIVATAREMDQLVSDMLSLSTVSRAEIARCRVDLGAIAEEILEGYKRAEPARQVAVVIQPDLTADADPGLARIILDNLLANAWKFTARRAPGRIELGSTVVEARPVYYVRDNGAGFAMQDAGHLFEPFRRLHPKAEFEGTGIGLATVRRIVRRHGGEVWADAAPGAGAVFYFTLEP